MRNKSYWRPLFIGLIALLSLISTPKDVREKFREYTVQIFSPFWNLSSKWQNHLERSSTVALKEEIARLRLDNQLLSEELSQMKELYFSEMPLFSELNELESSLHAENLLSGYHEKLKEYLSTRMQAIPARVIYRLSSYWNSSLWVNVGEEDNQALNHPIIEKNSPVLAGSSLIGIIDYVGKKQSRVRLITDPSLNPSVRVARGKIQDHYLSDQIEALQRSLEWQKNLNLTIEERENIQKVLELLHSKTESTRKSYLLAKGELCGSSHISWRKGSNILRGTGFNYDFADEIGEARDLRTGAVKGKQKSAITLLKPHDILVTTGYDGVFPPGLKVAEVTEVKMLDEGDYYYELEAISTAGNLDEISLVFIIPPLGYDILDNKRF